MQPIQKTSAPTTAIWAGALSAALIGAWILFDAEPGINWGIWVASASLTVVLARRFSGLPLEKPTLILLGWATLLAFAPSITASVSIRALVFLSVGMLLGLAVIVIGVDRWSSLSAKLLPTIPFLATFRVFGGTLREGAAVPRTIASPRARTLTRGLLITVPIVIILVVLLRNADPTLAWLVDRIAELLPQWSISARVVFFLFLLALTLGASSLAAHQRDSRLPALANFPRPGILGFTEQRMVLVAVAIVLWLFVVLQISYLFHEPPGVVGSGTTFAEYARRGFAQLSVAVTLVGGLILVLEATRAPEMDPARRRQLVRLEAALLIALELMLLSAFRRVILYEQAYGYTTMRVFAQAYMFVVALSLVALWLEVSKGAITIDFGRRVSVIALGTFTVLAFWNYAAWIANENFDRASRTGKFDSAYAIELSRDTDAIPTMVARRHELPEPERIVLENFLGCDQLRAATRWFEYSVRRRAAELALKGDSQLHCVPVVRAAPAPLAPDTSATPPTRP
ncbi:MAG TPA: DUF4173 domain-containing protein [Gemmatimonadaceae bacterium]